MTKIGETTIGDVKDFDLVMLMYDLLEYSLSFSGTACILWFYSNNEATNFTNNNSVHTTHFAPFI